MSCDGPVHLRRATPTDARAIAEVHVRTWQHAYAGIVPTDFLLRLDVGRREAFWRDEVTTLGEGRRPWVAECDGRVVGFVSAGTTRDEDGDARTGEVYAIYVDPECWSRGIGSNLMAHARRDLAANGYGTATLWVLAANAQARAFYEEGGWRLDDVTRTETIGGVESEEVRYRLTLG